MATVLDLFHVVLGFLAFQSWFVVEPIELDDLVTKLNQTQDSKGLFTSFGGGLVMKHQLRYLEVLEPQTKLEQCEITLIERIHIVENPVHDQGVGMIQVFSFEVLVESELLLTSEVSLQLMKANFGQDIDGQKLVVEEQLTLGQRLAWFVSFDERLETTVLFRLSQVALKIVHTETALETRQLTCNDIKATNRWNQRLIKTSH